MAEPKLAESQARQRHQLLGVRCPVSVVHLAGPAPLPVGRGSRVPVEV